MCVLNKVSRVGMELENCPLCYRHNNCCNGKEKSLGDCWCTKTFFPSELFDLLPPEAVRKTCICESCLNRFKSTFSDEN
ncbi:cysteine-rich CWC family protein [Sporosarcina ureilytica]|uniref:cysteine-rich CWC family protein n=1 Tax=Sporosarcina ureilytica TaxID=298596 RepID=UPI0009E32BDB